jgi:hypothetical protein
MKAVLSNEFDTHTNRIIGYDSAYTTPCESPGTDFGSYLRLGLPVPACVTDPKAAQKSWVQQMAWYADDTAGAFEPIPSVQEKGYYGARKVEKRASAPSLPVVIVKPVAEPCKAAKAEPFKSVLMYLAGMEKYTADVSRVHKELTTETLKQMLALVSNLTVHTVVKRVPQKRSKWRDRLDTLRGLEKGWDSYHAAAPEPGVFAGVEQFLDAMEADSSRAELKKLNPSVVGGIGLTFRNGTRSVYIEFRNTGNTHAAFVLSGTEPRVVKVAQDPTGYRAIIAETEKYLHEQAALGDESKRPSA